MNVKSLKTQFIAAIAMVLVAAIAMGSSTFAWFSMNSKVTVTGMTVTTTVKDNLLIAEAANDTTAATLNGPITSMPDANAYGTHIVQTKDALLEPTSTVDAAYNNFWYTDVLNVDSSGDAKTDTYLDYDSFGLAGEVTSGTDAKNNNFNVNYGITDTTLPAAQKAVGYVDYVFAIQATNTDASANKYLNLTKCDLTYQGASTAGLAFRTAVLVQECTNANTAETTATTKTILGCSDGSNSSAYFTNTETPAPKAVSGASTLTALTNYGTAANLATIAHGATNYYKVTVRLWLEGEDTTCNNKTYAELKDGNWNLDLKFELKDSTGGVTYMNYAAKAQNTYSIAAGTAKNSSGDITLSGITYHPYSATGGTIYSTDASAATNSKWFNIVDTSEVYEITEYVTVTTGGGGGGGGGG